MIEMAPRDGPDSPKAAFSAYLSDRLSALEAAPAVDVLLQGPSEVLATLVESWIRVEARQLKSAQTFPALAFYAAHKLVLLGEVGLLDWEAVQAALEEAKSRLIKLCPMEQQAQLRLDLGRLGAHRAHLRRPKLRAAKNANSSRPVAAGAAPLEGSLRVLALPDLLSTMEGSKTSGQMEILDAEGDELGSLWLREGKLTASRYGRREGHRAFWELLRDDRAESFRLCRPEAADPADDEPGQEIHGLLLEGMRQKDEMEFARQMVPDDAVLRPTGRSPSGGPESDGAFVRRLWLQISGGASPKECERTLGVEGYRIRTLLAHWLKEGAVEIEYRPVMGPAPRDPA